MQEHRGLGLDLGGLDQRLDLLQAVADQHAAGRKIAHQELVALFGKLRRGADVDNERHLPLFADLRDGERSRGIESTHDALRALVDRAFGLRPRDVRIGLHVDMHQFDLVAEISQHRGRNQRAAMTALPGLREIARLRQQHRYLQRLGLCPDDRGHGQKCRAGGGAGKQPAAAKSTVVHWHRNYPPSPPAVRPVVLTVRLSRGRRGPTSGYGRNRVVLLGELSWLSAGEARCR